MANNVPEVVVCFLIISCVGSIYVFSHVFLSFWSTFNGPYFRETQYSWIFRLGVNCFGYASVFLPGLLIYKYIKKTDYLNRHRSGRIAKLIRLCFGESENERGPGDGGGKKDADAGKSLLKDLMLLIFCFCGLMASYLTWGVLQEKIMTQTYQNANGVMSRFHDSQFLVFVNRLLAFAVSGIYLMNTKQPSHRAPMYKYSFCSFSNILSAWCQYEALKYVSFPTQVLAKACKIIPVMVMGKIIARNKYDFHEYVTAIMISLGMVCFMIGSANTDKGSTVTTLSGIILLIAYLAFDSFTSSFQGALFKAHSMTSIQMMCGVTLFSTLFTGASLLQQDGIMKSLNFMMEHKSFIGDCLLISASSAIGQLFIFFTIATFGPVAFTIIMTLRQAIAILLSCIIYKHHITAVGLIGIIIVFFAVFLRVYCKQRLRILRKSLESRPKTIV